MSLVEPESIDAETASRATPRRQGCRETKKLQTGMVALVCAKAASPGAADPKSISNTQEK